MDVRGLTKTLPLLMFLMITPKESFINAYSPEEMIYENDYLNPFTKMEPFGLI